MGREGEYTEHNPDGTDKCVIPSLDRPHTSPHTCHCPYFARLHSSSPSLEATHKNQSLDVKGVHLASNFRQTETTRTAPFCGSLPSMLCYHTAFYTPCEGTIFLRFSLRGPTLSLSVKVVATRFRFATCRSLWFLSLTLCEASCFSLWGICRLLAAFFFADTVSFSPSGGHRLYWGPPLLDTSRNSPKEGASVPGMASPNFTNNASTCSSIWDQRHATRADAAE